MKIINRTLCTVMIVVACFGTFSVCSFAETFDTSGTKGVFVSHVIGEPKIDIQLILNDKVTKEIVDERYHMFSVEKPEMYTFDTSTYLLEYNVPTEFWSSVSAMEYEGLTEAIDGSYPTIYIPLFGDIADSNGNMHHRVIGHIKLSYNWYDSDYRLGMSLYNLSSDDYKDKKDVWFYESIADYLNQSQTVAQQVFLIRYPSSLSDGHEKIAVIQTKDHTVVLDVSNSLNVHTDQMESGRAPAYKVSEYRSLRMEIEKELYQTASGWEKNPAGGNVDSNQDEQQTKVGEWILYVLMASFTVGVVTFRLFRKRVKHPSRQ